MLCSTSLKAKSIDPIKDGKTLVTTFILVRHAEKADQSKDTHLSRKGNQRAKQLDKTLSKTKVDAIYTTALNRTRQTAKFVAETNDITIQDYVVDSNFKYLTDQLYQKHLGQTIMIIGHSNTLPENISQLTKGTKNVVIEESAFDNLFIIHVFENEVLPVLIHLKYGD